ncbi:MAG: hypothetical protein ED859_06650 [Desulfuromonadales bacterium]|nr:MAG: hypothetical protein ED859_06650 [Desulfuromonadales bacterium]
MRGTIHNQIEALYHNCAKAIAISRHIIKAEGNGAHMIHSDSTRSSYVTVWHSLARHAASVYGVKSIDEISIHMAREWLDDAVKRKVAPATMSDYISAIHKFFFALRVNQERRAKL